MQKPSMSFPQAPCPNPAKAFHPVALILLAIGFQLTGLLHAAGPVVRFTPERGLSTADLTVDLRLENAPADAKIHFTTDGSLPEPQKARMWSTPMKVTDSLVIRAAAWLGPNRISPVETHSYLRIDRIPIQTGQGLPKTWGMREGKPVKAHYLMAGVKDGLPEMDAADLIKGLQAIPSLSVVMDPDDLFGEQKGIYCHPMEHGNAWERPCSFELLDATAPGRNTQVGSGIRIQGGWNRRPEECPKHSFRLQFRKTHGPDEWNFPLFGNDGPSTFNSLILRGGCNNTWLHWSSEERRRGEFIRDQWMRETYSAMGQVSARGFFAHLYLNGIYWGLYNLAERPDAAFASNRLGGKRSNYDSRNGENIISGDDKAWKELFAIANRGVRSAQNWSEIQALLNVTAFADYMLLNSYGANGDWDRVSNWYAARRRDKDGRFVFFVWDGERTLEGVEDNTLATDDDFCPTRLFQKLRTHPDFQRIFAERARIHLASPNGALSPERAAANYKKWSDPLDLAVVAESARWGNYRRDIHPYKTPPYEFYTRRDHWRPEVRRLLTDYFKQRPDALMRQLQSVHLLNPVENRRP